MLGIRSNIEFETKYERSKVLTLEFKIEENNFKPFAEENELNKCIYGAAVGGLYKFRETRDYKVQYRIQTESEPESTGGCTVTIIDGMFT